MTYEKALDLYEAVLLKKELGGVVTEEETNIVHPNDTTCLNCDLAEDCIFAFDSYNVQNRCRYSLDGEQLGGE